MQCVLPTLSRASTVHDSPACDTIREVADGLCKCFVLAQGNDEAMREFQSNVAAGKMDETLSALRTSSNERKSIDAEL